MVSRALIIACTGEKGTQDYIPGTLVDKENYKNYLMSYAGGSWYEKEIHTFVNPKKTDIEITIASMGISDFSIVIFSGHGGVYQNDNRMVIELGNQEYNIDNLRTKADRQITILDTCRTYIPSTMHKIAKSFNIAESFKEGKNSRNIYEQEIMKCVSGVITLFSCSKGEASNDDIEMGGYFSFSLLAFCKEWIKEKRSDKILNIKQVFDYSKEVLNSSLTTNQNPEIIPTIRSNWFPFAINKNNSF